VINGQQFSYYRSNNTFAIFRPRDLPASRFLPEDNKVLNELCERPQEGKRNKTVKREISAALSAYFNKQSFHIYEFGSGYYPISSYFRDSVTFTYQGIDSDEHCIEELHRMNVPASNWATITGQEPPHDKPSVATSVYAMHFMIDQDFADRIKLLTSADGFFIGNFYVDPGEMETGAERQRLRSILEQNSLYHIVLKDRNPNKASNEYWIIGKADSVPAMHNFASAMQTAVAKHCDRKLEVKNTAELH